MLCDGRGGSRLGLVTALLGQRLPADHPSPAPAARCRGRSGPRCEGCASQGRCSACFRSPRQQPPLPQPLSKTGGWLCSGRGWCCGSCRSGPEVPARARTQRGCWAPLPPASGLPACGLQAGLGASLRTRRAACQSGAGVSAARGAGPGAAAKLPVLPGCPLLVLPDGPGLAPKPSFWRSCSSATLGMGSGGTPHFSPGRFLWVFSVARAGPSLQHVSTYSPGGKGCRPGLGTHSGLAMSDPSTWAVRTGH